MSNDNGSKKQPPLPRFSRIELGSNHQQMLNEISKEFGYNYITNSFGENDKPIIDVKEFAQYQGLIDELKSRDLKKHRNIMIIGAGASKDAYSELPLGKDMIAAFEKKFIEPLGSVSFLKTKYEQFKKDSKSLNNNIFDFENFLYILSEHFLTQEELRKEISHFTQFRYSPSLFYEAVAHFLKHSFLDAVINFNFEEILDQAIEEEIGQENYNFVLSDGHCFDLSDMVVDGRLKMPLYVKPHGTASHKSTLRFTKRHYLDLPSDIRNMLEDLIGGYRGNGFDKIERINLFVVGFDLNSIEFNDIFNELLPKDSRIYHFGLAQNGAKADFIDKHLPKFKGRLEKNNVKLTEAYQYFPLEQIADINSSTENKLTTPLAEVFSHIWRNTHFMFRDLYKPRSIARHELLSYLFQKSKVNYESKQAVRTEKGKDSLDKLRDTYDNSAEYFRDRVIFEIALELNRSNGVVDIVSSLHKDNRIGRYYSKYMNYCQLNNIPAKDVRTIYELFQVFVNKDEIPPGISFKGAEFRFADNIFNLKVQDFDNGGEWERKLQRVWHKVPYQAGQKIPTERNDANELVKALIKIFKIKSQENLDSKSYQISLTVLYHLFSSSLLTEQFKIRFYEKFKLGVHNGKIDTTKKEVVTSDLLQEIFRLITKSADSHYYYIRPKYQDSKNYMWESFAKERLIHTNLALSYEFNDIFFNRPWNLLLAVLETGEIIRNIVRDLVIQEKAGELNQKKSLVLKNIRNGKKRIVLISAYSGVNQLHNVDAAETNKEFCDLIDKHKGYISNPLPNYPTVEVWQKDKIDVLLLPSIQHNHHTTLFLNIYGKVPNTFPASSAFFNNKYSELISSIVGCIYMYRRGYSHSINPLYLGPEYNQVSDQKTFKDVQKALKLFFTYFTRADEFKRDSIANPIIDADTAEFANLHANCASILQEFLDNMEKDTKASSFKFFNDKTFKKHYIKFEEALLATVKQDMIDAKAKEILN